MKQIEQIFDPGPVLWIMLFIVGPVAVTGQLGHQEEWSILPARIWQVLNWGAGIPFLLFFVGLLVQMCRSYRDILDESMKVISKQRKGG